MAADGSTKTVRLDPEREMQALEALKLSLADELRDDPEFLLDLAEGETSLFEVIDAMLTADALDAGLIDGAGKAMRDIEARMERFEKRSDRRRALLEQALMLLEVKKLERPAATISLQNRKPKIEVIDESAIPSEYFTTKVVLDKKALNAACEEILKARDDAAAAGVDAARAMPTGVAIGNGTVSITIRRK